MHTYSTPTPRTHTHTHTHTHTLTTPPPQNKVFPIAWSVFYASMGVAAWFVQRSGVRRRVGPRAAAWPGAFRGVTMRPVNPTPRVSRPSHTYTPAAPTIRAPGSGAAKSGAMTLYALQLGLNLAWT